MLLFVFLQKNLGNYGQQGKKHSLSVRLVIINVVISILYGRGSACIGHSSQSNSRRNAVGLCGTEGGTPPDAQRSVR